MLSLIRPPGAFPYTRRPDHHSIANLGANAHANEVTAIASAHSCLETEWPEQRIDTLHWHMQEPFTLKKLSVQQENSCLITIRQASKDCQNRRSSQPQGSWGPSNDTPMPQTTHLRRGHEHLQVFNKHYFQSGTSWYGWWLNTFNLHVVNFFLGMRSLFVSLQGCHIWACLNDLKCACKSARPLDDMDAPGTTTSDTQQLLIFDTAVQSDGLPSTSVKNESVQVSRKFNKTPSSNYASTIKSGASSFQTQAGLLWSPCQHRI